MTVEDALLEMLGDRTLGMKELIDGVATGSREQRIAAVRELLDRGVLTRVDGLNVRRAK
ncbi:MAG: hypothetical protein U0176_11790 [Bacteroidia bacterium]